MFSFLDALLYAHVTWLLHSWWIHIPSRLLLCSGSLAVIMKTIGVQIYGGGKNVKKMLKHQGRREKKTSRYYFFPTHPLFFGRRIRLLYERLERISFSWGQAVSTCAVSHWAGMHSLYSHSTPHIAMFVQGCSCTLFQETHWMHTHTLQFDSAQ